MGAFQCNACGAHVVACPNRDSSACNSLVRQAGELCHFCLFTEVLPDFSDAANMQRWVELERAKRRLLLQLKELALPPYVGNIEATHSLRFRFLANMRQEDGSEEIVYTGHADGVITINVLEADSVHRESTRVALGEPQRTLIGHMRHEVGHYLDWCYASRVAADEYRELFGDPAQDYEAAKSKHYQQGPLADWQTRFVSPYATMHPWEDFAETVNAYLDVTAIAETANDQDLACIDISPQADTTDMINAALEIAISVSEFNLDLGIPALLPESLSPAVIDKLAFVHRLRSEAYLSRLLNTPLTANC